MLFTRPLLSPSVARLQGGERWAPTLPRTHTHIPYLHHFRDQIIHCASFFRLTVCPFSPVSGVSLVLRAVLASLGCSMVVTPWFLPSLQRWQWSPLPLGLLPFSVRSQSIRYCSMTRANSFPSHRHLRLTLIARDGSCSRVVLGWFMTSDACVAKGRFFPEGKYPATSFFSHWASLCLHPHPNTFTALSLEFIFENTC